MNKLTIKRFLSVGLLVMLSQQVVAGDWRQSPRDQGMDYWQSGPSRQSEYRHEGRNYDRRPAAAPLPRGYSRVYVGAGEYLYANGSFYRPSPRGYVAVAAPVGAVIDYLPRYKRVTYWHGRPYYVAGNTFFRKHAHGYVVVPNPGGWYRH